MFQFIKKWVFFVSTFLTSVNSLSSVSMARTNETRHIKWHETCKCKCRLDARVCNNKQRWNDDKCRCECKELIDKGVCDKGYAWNPSNCECECDKSCDVGEYLDYENCKCRRRLVDKLLEECNENIDEAKLTKISLFEDKNKCVCSYTVFIALAVIALTVSIEIGAYFVYYKYINHNKENVSKKKDNDVLNGFKNKIEEVSSGERDYEKNYMKIKSNSDDKLPLNKPLKFHSMTITIRSVFEEDSKLYPQVFLDDTLYELNV